MIKKNKPLKPDDISPGTTVKIDGKAVTIDDPQLVKELMNGEKPCYGIKITEKFLLQNGFTLKGKTFILLHLGNTIKARRMMGHFRFQIFGEPLHENMHAPYHEDFIYHVHHLESICRTCRISKKWTIPEDDSQEKEV